MLFYTAYIIVSGELATKRWYKFLDDTKQKLRESDQTFKKSYSRLYDNLEFMVEERPKLPIFPLSEEETATREECRAILEFGSEEEKELLYRYLVMCHCDQVFFMHGLWIEGAERKVKRLLSKDFSEEQDSYWMEMKVNTVPMCGKWQIVEEEVKS